MNKWFSYDKLNWVDASYSSL